MLWNVLAWLISGYRSEFALGLYHPAVRNQLLILLIAPYHWLIAKQIGVCDGHSRYNIYILL